ncbi:vacuolar membrane protein [Annulohypoxylon bovei var. microspora]|nr:vacuolar membrane protein [Annulohypoxylon bovei var. microspora]
MAWELTRRRIIRAVNSKFIFDRIPLLHAVIFFIEMAIVARLVSRFNAYYDERPVLTMMVTNAVLGGIADTVAQTITSVRERALRKPGGITKDDTVAIEIHELDRKNSWDDRELIPESKDLPPPFDFERLTRFMAYGFGMAPLQYKWFSFLSRAFPITKTSAFVPAMKRVAFDQLIFAPFGIGCFFTVMTVAEGGGRRAVAHKLRDMYIPTLKANFMVWPAVQIINFRLMPVQFQLVSFFRCDPQVYLGTQGSSLLTVYCSHSFLLLVLPGQHTYPLRMPPKTSSRKPHLTLLTSVSSKPINHLVCGY